MIGRYNRVPVSQFVYLGSKSGTTADPSKYSNKVGSFETFRATK